MFGDKKRLEHELSGAGGRAAWATVLDVKKWASSGGVNMSPGQAGSFTNHCKLRLQVEPEGEPAFEVTIHHEFRDSRGESVPLQGWRLAVRFDPADHAKVIVDEGKAHLRPGLDAAAAGRSQARRDQVMALARDPAAMQQYIQQMKAIGTSPAATSAGLGTIDGLTKLADLRDRGVLTQAEFDAQKAKILEGNG